jgi:hypothetical protein
MRPAGFTFLRLLIHWLTVVGLLLAYVILFWGRFTGQAWPPAVRSYAGWADRAVWSWVQQRLPAGADLQFYFRLTWLAVSVLLGLVVPLAVLALFGRRPADVGLGQPNRWGRRIICVGLAVVLMMSIIFAVEIRRMPNYGGSTLRLEDLPILLGVSVPEHVLLTGVAVALLLPGMRLPRRTDMDEQCSRRPGLLGWLGLGLPGKAGNSLVRQVLAWWGLEPESFWAVVGGGFLFGAVHVGARPIELATSFPGGLLLCYVTVRSGSIWPGWLVHVAQILLVTVILALVGPV